MIAPLTAYEENILGNVEEFGCHITTVFAPDGDEPAFSYSSGFPASVGEPEVIIFGLSSEMRAYVINRTIDACREGFDLVDGSRLPGVLDGFDLFIKALPPEAIQRKYLNSAMWFHEERFGTPLTNVVQLVWPSSKTGLFPWEDGCEADVSESQPPLYRVETSH